MKKPLLSVIVPTFNRETHLVDVIKQVLADKFKELELIVVDQTDKHEEATQKFLESVKDPRFHYYLVGEPKSGVAAKNYALQNAKADIVVVLDDDVILDPECLSIHYRTYQERPDIGGVAGRIEQDGHERATKVLRFNRWGIPSGRFNYLKAQYTDTAPGGNMSVRRDKALEIGGFDTNFLRSQDREESDFCFRYVRAGNTFYFEPAAWLLHLAAGSGGTRVKMDFADNPDYYRNNLYFTLRFCRWYLLPLALLIQLRFYSLRRDPRVSLRRLKMFVVGLGSAIRRHIFPRHLVVKPIRELP